MSTGKPAAGRAAAAVGVVCLGQWLAGSLYNHPRTAEGAGRRWPLRWTLLGLGGLALLFCLTIASAGIIHQTGWLASSEQRLVQSSWDTPTFHLRRLCNRLEEFSGKSFADAASTFWATARLSRVTDEYRILLVEAPNHTLADIVAIPHALAPEVGRLQACRGGEYPAEALIAVLDAVRAGRLPPYQNLPKPREPQPKP